MRSWRRFCFRKFRITSSSLLKISTIGKVEKKNLTNIRWLMSKFRSHRLMEFIVPFVSICKRLYCSAFRETRDRFVLHNGDECTWRLLMNVLVGAFACYSLFSVALYEWTWAMSHVYKFSFVRKNIVVSRSFILVCVHIYRICTCPKKPSFITSGRVLLENECYPCIGTYYLLVNAFIFYESAWFSEKISDQFVWINLFLFLSAKSLEYR